MSPQIKPRPHGRARRPGVGTGHRWGPRRQGKSQMWGPGGESEHYGGAGGGGARGAVCQADRDQGGGHTHGEHSDNPARGTPGLSSCPCWTEGDTSRSLRSPSCVLGAPHAPHIGVLRQEGPSPGTDAGTDATYSRVTPGRSPKPPDAELSAVPALRPAPPWDGGSQGTESRKPSPCGTQVRATGWRKVPEQTGARRRRESDPRSTPAQVPEPELSQDVSEAPVCAPTQAAAVRALDATCVTRVTAPAWAPGVPRTVELRWPAWPLGRRPLPRQRRLLPPVHTAV